MPMDRDKVFAVLKAVNEKLAQQTAQLTAMGQPTHVQQNPMVMMMFMQAAQQVGQEHGISVMDVASAEEDFKDDAEVMKQMTDFKAKLEASGLPTAVPK
eukprot:gene11075-4821_t